VLVGIVVIRLVFKFVLPFVGYSVAWLLLPTPESTLALAGVTFMTIVFTILGLKAWDDKRPRPRV
jgi:hypothetical protein